jgi:hypothetical protein
MSRMDFPSGASRSMKQKTPFSFLDSFDSIVGPVVSLRILSKVPQQGKEPPFYWYSIVETATGEAVGKVSLRVGDGLQAYWGGNVGYEVDEPHRGHRYAYEATKLLFPLAKQHGMDCLFISCEDSNIASARTIELLGGVLLEKGVPPRDYYAYSEGIGLQRVYRILVL